MSETHWKKLTNPEYLGAYAFNPGEEKIVTIDHVTQEELIGENGKASLCIVAYLQNEKPLVLNKTNCKAISKLLKTPYIEEWAGARIALCVQMVKAFGEDVETVKDYGTIGRLVGADDGAQKGCLARAVWSGDHADA